MGSNDDPAIKGGGAPPLPTPDINELREILLGDSWRKLQALEREILDPGNFSRRVAGVLPESLRVANDTPVSLVGAMQDPTIESISIAARKEQQRLSEALAPVIGPSIQRAIVQALQSFTQSIETIAEHNFSLKGLKWRIESARSGVPFHQIVLKHTLKYEVEQVYLIQNPSGLLVTHLMHPDLAEQSVDRDAVAGMMMAIQDFVRDSAFAESSESVQTIELQGKTVWMCHGAWALLACVIEGRPPQNLREQIKTVLDATHGHYQHALREFNGDLGRLVGVEVPLQSLLQKELIETKHQAVRKSRLPIWLGLISAAFIAWLIYLAYAGYEIHAQRNRLVAALNATPGVAITDLEHVNGIWKVRGLADPIAFDPNAIAARAAIKMQQLKFDFLPYISLQPDLILRRARAALNPPASVTLQMNNRVLVATGIADQEWVNQVQRTSASLLNVERFDLSGLQVDSSLPLKRIADQLAAAKILFSERLQLAAQSQAQLAELAESIKRAKQLALSNGQSVQVILTGHADATGAAAINQALKLDRAQIVKARLVELGVTEAILVVKQDQTDTAMNDHHNRRVGLQLELLSQSPR
jgi:outer membrane protein OmpA-like peptidoglycan-associated protein